MIYYHHTMKYVSDISFRGSSSFVVVVVVS